MSLRIARPKPEPDLLRFSFRYLDTAHPRFTVAGQGGTYLRLLLARLRDLSGLRVSEFRTNRLRSLRIHPIDFGAPGVSVAGFGLPPWVEADDKAWQFALSANEHGRVHGFLVAKPSSCAGWIPTTGCTPGTERPGFAHRADERRLPVGGAARRSRPPAPIARPTLPHDAPHWRDGGRNPVGSAEKRDKHMAYALLFSRAAFRARRPHTPPRRSLHH
jgi:hypothetical protein